MNTNERFKNLMSFRKVDRLPIVEWAPYWDKTIDRWHTEGLPGDMTEACDIRRYFGLDRYLQLPVFPRSALCPWPSHHGGKIIEDEKDYEAIRPCLYPDEAFPRETLRQWAQEQQQGQAVIWFTVEGFFWYPRVLFGIEGHMYAFFDKPKLMKRMNQDLLEFHLRVLDEICGICVPDFMSFAEDMSYNHGPMLSKACFDEFLLPYYKEFVPELKKRRILSLVDSDGDVTNLIPWLIEAGVDGIFPLERMAGVDVAKIRREHPAFKLMGGFDKTIMHLGEEAMRAEFERLLPVMKKGGFLASVDHQTPPDVSLSHYRIFVRLLKEYCQKASQ
jgi:hypothetical protein